MGAFSSKNQMPVDGKTVLITGASEGMGRSAARQLAEKGANVIIVARNVGRLEEALAEVQAAARNPQTQRFHYISADVSKPDYAAPLLAEAIAWNNGNPIDIVWCVAGKSVPGFWLEAPLSSTREQMDLNFWGSAELAHAVLREWCAPDAPVVPEPRHFIFTASVLALFPVIGYGPYNPSKGALKALADTLVQEVEIYPQKVKVHIVYPGTIGSPGLARENKTKPEITQILEADDPVQTPDAVAASAIQGLEKGQYSITVALLGHVFRWSALGGGPRNNWFIDTVMSWIVSIVWMFALPDLYGKIRKYAKKNGHPATYKKTNSRSPSTYSQTMETFHHFTDLPIELRRMIWAEFLAYERKRRRLVLIDWSRCVRPKLELCSPLLSANAESRAFARDRYYTVALVLREASSGRSKGTVYVDPEHDIFLLMEEFHWNVYRERRTPSSAANSLLAEKYITRRIPRRACARVRKSMDTSPYWIEKTYDPVEYFNPDPFAEDREQDSVHEAREAAFKGLESCIHLLTDPDDEEMPSVFDDSWRISLEDLIAK
ncbi:hypothetical protein DL764_005262 [Monosporascus ibericus]|uniref:3-dehydrosphinganine reductase n=1 Tax=Monosporascus ibericus TaxID=155417 RepID=A0A4V1XAM5_9PEZI|nr:hypothetical protein DL764_005262 [Monosporascus ibericus]